MSDFKTPLNDYSFQKGFEKVKKTEQIKLEKFEQELKKVIDKIKRD